MTENEEFMQALNAFQGESGQAASSQALDLCGTYKKVRPILAGILPSLKLIPKIGAAAAAAIKALMDVLDAACGAVHPQSAMAGVGLGDDEFSRALAQFQTGAEAAPLPGAQAVNVCDTYKKVKPILNGILPFLGLIPVIGSGAATAIKALMLVLDGICK